MEVVIENPRFLTVTLALADTTYNLLTLLKAADTEFNESVYQSVRRLVVQGHFDAAGTRYKIGNAADLSDVNFGAEFQASQSLSYEDDGDTIILDHIGLRATIAASPVHVALQFR